MKMIDSKLDAYLISYLIKLINKTILNYQSTLAIKQDCHSETYNSNSMEMKVSTNKLIDLKNNGKTTYLYHLLGCYVHQKIGQSIEFITAKTQEKIDIFLGHYDVPYGLVNIIISGELGEIESNEEVNIVAFLPNLLTKYFQFMDLDAYVFKLTWKQMSQYVQRTDIFTISKSIIKAPIYFRKFFTKTLELTPLDLFLSQQSHDTKYYKLGALIELYDAESKFLLKFNIRPDNTLCIQVIATNQAYRTTAAVLLQHLRFLLQG